MFQYALGRSLAARHLADLVLDIRALESDPLRQYALDAFTIDAKIASSRDRPQTSRWANRILRRLPRWMIGRHQVVENAFTFDPNILSVEPPARLVGNWQSEKYFIDVADAVRREFSLREEIAPRRRSLAGEIVKSVSVSVHVRRGDYVSNSQAQAYHGSIEVDWYRAAMAKLHGGLEDPHYFIFSDDPEWARLNLVPPGQTTFVDPLGDGRDWEDMRLMSLCRHHIIANSSFSWWGAWLNSSPDKKVVAPARWFRNAPHDTKDLIPASWHRL